MHRDPVAVPFPMIRPFHVTTNAAVIVSGGSNAAATARATRLPSSEVGNGVSGSISPIGHGVVDGSGRVLSTSTGVKYTVSSPVGSVTHPWSPTRLAVRVTPLSRVRWTAWFSRSMTRSTTRPRCSYGPEKPDVLGSEVRVKTSDEHGRAERLCEARCVMNEWVAGRRDVVGVHLERGGPPEQLLQFRSTDLRCHWDMGLLQVRPGPTGWRALVAMTFRHLVQFELSRTKI